MLSLARLYPGRSDALDRRLVDVDEVHVVLVVDLVVTALQRHAASPEPVVLRNQLLSDFRIVHTLSDFPADERSDRGVCLRNDHQVLEVGHPDTEAWLGVQLLVKGLTLLLADGQRTARLGLVDESAPRL